MARKILMVSSYPPMACGIATYAAQSVAALRKQGSIVDVLSLPGGDGDFIEDLRGEDKLLRLLEYRQAYDEIILQYCPHFYFVSYDFPGARWSNLRTCLAMRKVFRKCGNVTVICHEETYSTADQLGRLMAWAERIKWKHAARIVFHTRRELDAFAAAYLWSPADPRLVLREHHQDFQKRTTMTQVEARKHCGWPLDKTVFLAIGFIQPHKGFDRAMRAFSAIPHRNAELYVIGSTRYDDQDMQAYIGVLEELAHQTDGITLNIGFVSDELFDIYIVAADYILIPYREIWSSGVLARAKLYKKPVIATQVGGLAEQMGPDDILISDDRELEEVMRSVCDRSFKVRTRQDGIELSRDGQSVVIPEDKITILREALNRWQED